MKNPILPFFALLSLLGLSNKITAQEAEIYPQVWFDEKDASNKLLEGKSTITGSAFTRQYDNMESNKKKAKKGTKVLLFPITEYLSEAIRWQKIIADINGRVIMTEKAFSYRLETSTDENGNFAFYNMKPGRYFIQCNLDFVGHDVALEEVGRTDYYNGYGYAGSSPIYKAYNYTYDGNHLLVRIIEIKEDGEVIDADLKPNPWFKSYKQMGAQLAVGDKCGSNNGKKFGKCTDYYDNGQPYIISKWKDGAQDGITLVFYETGELSEKSDWKNGQLNGTTTFYNKDQSVSEIATYKNNIKIKSKMN